MDDDSDRIADLWGVVSDDSYNQKSSPLRRGFGQDRVVLVMYPHLHRQVVAIQEGWYPNLCLQSRTVVELY